jgi:hypothetical protein
VESYLPPHAPHPLPPGLMSAHCAQLAAPVRRRESVFYYNVEAGAALAVTLFINAAVISVFALGFYGRCVAASARSVGCE